MTLRTRMACMVILLLLGCVFAAPFYQTVSSKDQFTESTLPTLQIQWETGSTKDVEVPASKAKPTATRENAHSAGPETSNTVDASTSAAAPDQDLAGSNANLSRKTRAIFSRPIPDLDMPSVKSSRDHRFTTHLSNAAKAPTQSPTGIATRAVTSEIQTPNQPLATLGQAVASDPSAKESADRFEHRAGDSAKWGSLQRRPTGRRFAATEIQWNRSTVQVAQKEPSTSDTDSFRARTSLAHLHPLTERKRIPIQPRNQQEQVRNSQTVLPVVSSQLASAKMRSSAIRPEWERDTRRQLVKNPDPQPRWHRISRFDNLSELSKKYYGTPEYALFIFEANRQSLASPDILPLGLELIIPARTRRIQATTRQPSHSSGQPEAPLSPVEVQYGWRGAYED